MASARVAGGGAYTEAVDPFMHAARVRDIPARCDRVLPYRRLDADLAGGRLPTVAFVVPNLRDDMHSGSVAAADAWLRRLVEAAFGLPFLGHAADPATATIPAVADPP